MDYQYKQNAVLDLVEPSRSVTLLAKVRKLQESDPSIINLTGGEPDFATPEPICREACRQMLAGFTHYGDSKGDPELREAIAKKLQMENHMPYQAEQILITPGGKYAILLTLQAILNPGDEVLCMTPGWVSYPAMVTLCHASPVMVHLERNADYAIHCEVLEQSVTDKTRMIILNYPNNPTGRILSEKDLQELKRFLRRHPQILCLSDEIYEKIIFDGKEHLSLASDPEFSDRTILVNGFSKCSAMTGWRIGYLACNPEIYAAVLKIFQHSISCVSGFIQKGAVAALQIPEETERMRAAYERRRNIVYQGLKDIPGVTLDKPEGSFYAWVRFDTDQNAEELCTKLLEKAGIGGIPGSSFGETEECAVRFCFASDDAVLREFVSRMQRFCETEL